MKRFLDFAANNKKKFVFGVLIVAAVVVLCVGLVFGTEKNRQDKPKETSQITEQTSEETARKTPDQKEQSAKEKSNTSSENTLQEDNKQKEKSNQVTDKTDSVQIQSESQQKNDADKTSSQKSADKSEAKTEKVKKSDSLNSSKDTAAQPPKASHQHSWKAHKVWVSKMVTVVDEPEHVVAGAQLYTEQPDGTWLSNGETYWFENGFTIDDLEEIIFDKMKNEDYIGNYVNRKKTVPAVTHTEDHGSYQTDYYYCSCGAVKK